MHSSFPHLTKIGTDKNKAIYSIGLLMAKMCYMLVVSSAFDMSSTMSKVAKHLK